MRASRNVIEQTWVAYAFGEAAGEVEPRLERVGAHYSALIAEPLSFSTAGDRRSGLALWARRDERLRWPLWSDDGTRVIASTGVPTGWARLVGELEPARAPAELARVIASSPERAAELDPPFTLGVLERDSGSIAIANDLLGAGRLYELRLGDGWVWSNRLGALPLFAGARPEIDERAWAVFAAAGWFLGEMTPIEGARKVPPGSVVRVDAQRNGIRVSTEQTGASRDAVAPRRTRFVRSAERAANEVVEMATDLGAAWDVPIAISLTGGRDSRVSAAAAVRAGIPATFNTGDQVPGEVDVVRELVARSPTSMDHTVYTPEQEEDPGADLAERIRRIHLVHDGMRNPQEVRRPSEVPQLLSPRPTLSGHGGELGHGFYYSNARKLRKLKGRSGQAIRAQLERNARRRHSAATDEAYELYLRECERTLELGRSFGLRGPVLLDWFYMAQRLPYRSGLGARSGRSSACVAPAFVRGAFDLRPKDRLTAKLHRAVVARLVPEWADVPFFRSEDAEEMPDIHRLRIWERPQEAATVEEMIGAAGGWTRMLDRGRIERMWAEVRDGAGSADYEHVFYRLVWRVGFEAHLDELGRLASN